MLITKLKSVANLRAKGGGNACGRNLKIAGQNSGPPSSHFSPN